MNPSAPFTKFPCIAAAFVAIAILSASSVRAANPADWKNFTSTSAQNWNNAANWTAGTGIPTSGTSLTINFDPSKAGTTTSGGGISAGTFTSTNDLGTVQLNALNLAGVSSGSARTITISGGTLQFGGTSPSITNTTTTSGTGGLTAYTITSNILLDSDLALNLNGTGATTLLAGTAGGSLSANTTGLKTITSSGTGSGFLGAGTTILSVISDGSGQVGITQAGTGTLTLGGNNTFTGDVLIKSGTVAVNTTSAGTATSLGAGTIKIGDTTGTASATLQVSKSTTFTNAMTVQLGSSGTKTIENAQGGGSTAVLTGPLTLNDDLVVRFSGGAGAGGVTIGAVSATSYITGNKNLTFEHSGTGANKLQGTNTGFTGNVIVNSGRLTLANTAALSSTNTVAVASGASLELNNVDGALAGLNNVSGSGGTVTNTGGAARVLTLGGSGTYSFGGVITATTPANLALTVALTGGGKQTLSGNSTYTGVTTLTSGTLIINGDNSGATGAFAVNGGTLGGGGTIGGNTSIANNATLAPGNSAGLLTFTGTLTMSGLDSKSNFEIATGTRGTNYDAVNVTGLLTYNGDLTLTMASTIANGTYDLFGGASGGALTQTGSFDTIAFAGGAYSGLWSNNSGIWTAASGGQTFTFTQSTGDLTVVPEPATWGLLAFSLTTVLVLRRRR